MYRVGTGQDTPSFCVGEQEGVYIGSRSSTDLRCGKSFTESRIVSNDCLEVDSNQIKIKIEKSY